MRKAKKSNSNRNRAHYRRIILLICLLAIPLLLVLVPMEWLTGDESRTFCLYTNLTGRNCWGCGMTRALVSVMKGEFAAAWHYNRLIAIVFPMLVWFWARWIWKLTGRLKQHKKSA